MAVDHLGARLGEGAFADFWKFFVEFARDGQAQDGVAQEFQALIVLHRPALFVGDGRVGESQTQLTEIAELIPEGRLKFFDYLVGHGL